MIKRLFRSSRNAVIVIASLTIGAIVIAAFVVVQMLYREDLSRTQRETEHLARTLAAHAGESFRSADRVLRNMQDRLQEPSGIEQALDSPALTLLLNARLRGLPHVASLFIVGRDGRIMNSTQAPPFGPLLVQDRQRYGAFINERSDTLFISGPILDPDSGKWMLYLGRRLHDANNRFRGVVMAALTLAYFEELYDYLEPEFMHRAALYLADGRLLASQPPHPAAVGHVAPELEERLQAAASVPETANPGASNPAANPDSTMENDAVFQRVAGYPLLVGVSYEWQEKLAAARERAVPIAIGAALFCLFIFLASALLLRKLQREEALAQALRVSGDEYRHTVDSAMDAMISIDAAQAIIKLNNAAERMFRVTAKEALGRPFSSLVPAPLREKQSAEIAQYLEAPASVTCIAPTELTGLRADGSEFPVEATFSPMRIDDKPRLAIALRDITERRRRENEMSVLNDELRRLSNALQHVRDSERMRLSRELHDELGQQLTGLKLDLSWLAGSLRSGRPARLDRLDAMRDSLDEAIAAVRRIATELRPPVLDDLAFGDAVAWHAAEFTRRSGIEVVLNMEAQAEVSDERIATALFRIVQEALTNAARHADAKRVEISLRTDGDRLQLRIHDDGKGFDSANTSMGIGLLSMRERAAELAGLFRVISRRGEGTTIEVRVPKAPLASQGGRNETAANHDRRRSRVNP